MPTFLANLTDGTRYRACKIGSTWLVEPRSRSLLDYPVTMDTSGLTVDEAVQAIAAQAPPGSVITAGMTVIAMPRAAPRASTLHRGSPPARQH